MASRAAFDKEDAIPESAPSPSPGRAPSLSQGLARRWWIVVLVVAASLGVAAYQTARQQPIYKATATLVVRPSSEVVDDSGILRTLDTLDRRSVLATFATIPGTDGTSRAAAKSLELNPAARRAYSIRGSVVPNTNLLRIEVYGPDAKLTADVANAAALKTADEARRLYRIFALDELERASEARRPVSPNPQRNYVAAGVLGLFLGIGAALAYDRARRPVPARSDDAPGRS